MQCCKGDIMKVKEVKDGFFLGVLLAYLGMPFLWVVVLYELIGLTDSLIKTFFMTLILFSLSIITLIKMYKGGLIWQE